MQTQLIIRYDFNGVVYAQGSGFNKNECFIFLLGPGTEVLCFSFFQDVDQPINRISFFFSYCSGLSDGHMHFSKSFVKSGILCMI